MAKQIRAIAWPAVILFVATAGCAFPHGSKSGDPLLGSFNRPLAQTPPPERGGIGLASPAYDGGVGIGLTPPDVARPHQNSSGFMSLPPLHNPGFAESRIPDPKTKTKPPFDGVSEPPLTIPPREVQ